MSEEIVGARVEFNTSSYITSIQDIINRTNDFRESIKRARETMESASRTRWETRVRVDNSQAIRSTKEIKDNIRRLRENRPIIIAAKNMAKEKIKNVLHTLGKLTGRPHRIILKAIDRTKRVINGIKNSIFNLKTLAGAIVFGATAKMGFDNTIGAGSRLEQEEVSMKHFIGYQNKEKKGFNVEKATKDYIAKLRHNANVTPFGTNEVISAGRRAINIMQGDTKQGMNLVNLAEDMAALNPGKTVMDAMEALADLKTGEAERMKEFGFKFSAQDFVAASGAPKKKDKKGKEKKMKMSDLTDNQFTTAYNSIVKNKLAPFFQGGAGKLAKTAAGQWSTTTGMLQSMGADIGKPFLPSINKILAQVNKRFESFSGSKTFENIKKQVDSFANVQGKKVLDFLDKIEKHPEILTKGFNNVKNTIKDISNIVSTVGKLAKEAYNIAKPFIDFAGKNPKTALGILAGLKLGPRMFRGILRAPKNIKQLKKDFLDLKTALSFLKGGSINHIKGIGRIFKSIGKSISFAITKAKLFGAIFTGALKTKSLKGLKGLLNVTKGIGKGIGKGILKGLKSTLKIIKTAGKGLKLVFKGIGKGASIAFKTTLKIVKIASKGIGKGLMGLLKIIRIVGRGMISVISKVTAVMIANPIIAIIVGIIAICVLVYQAWKHNWGGIRDKTKVVIDFCKEKINSIKETFQNVKTKCIEFGESVKKKWEELKEFFKHPIKGSIELAKKGAAWVKGKIDGSHATGLTKVPYNNYVAELHEGEEVLTAQKARSLNNGNFGGVNIAKLADSIVVREDTDIDKITDMLVRKLKKTTFNMA